MAIVKAKCPNCGKYIEIESEEYNVVCSFCGVPFFPKEAIDAYNKELSELVNNINIDTLNVNADNISNYATLGFAALKDKNHEKCGFYADDILKRKADSPEGLLFKAFFISNNYSKEEGMRYYVLSYNNASKKELKDLIIATFVDEFIEYSMDNFVYLIKEVISKKTLDDISFVKEVLIYLSSSIDEYPLLDELNITKEIVSLYFDLTTYKTLNVDNYDIYYNDSLIFSFNDQKLVVFADRSKLDEVVEKFAPNKKEDARIYNCYVKHKIIAFKLKKVSLELENVFTEMGLKIEEIKSGCYIATCVYQSYQHPKVRLFRRFRDEVLSLNIFGRLFIKFYYKISPTLVKHFQSFKWFKNINKTILDYIANKLYEKGYSDLPYKDKR